MTTRTFSSRLSLFAITAACALALAACGGGGGGGGGGTTTGTGTGTDTGGGNNPTATEIRTLEQQAVANGNYVVNVQTAGTVAITLPANASINVGDTVRVAGVSSNRWTIKQNAGQFINTSNVGGNAAPGVNWTAVGPADGFWITGMSADGNTMLAATNSALASGSGDLYVSRDHGTTWTAIGTRAIWSAVDVSSNGMHMVAVEVGGGVYVSHDGGATFTSTATGAFLLGAAISDDGTKVAVAAKGGRILVSTSGSAFTAVGVTGQWEHLAMSNDGTRIVAVASGSGAASGVYVSTNGGTSFTRTAAQVGEWYRVAASADGMTIVASENPGRVIKSIDGGTTWTTIYGATTAVTVNQIAMSANGQVIGLAITADAIQLSTDGGTTFVPVGTAGQYRALSMSADGDTLLSATFGSNGRLSLSQGNRTSIGTFGSMTGGQGDTLVLTYAGNGQFNATSSTGTFTIQ